MVVLVAARHFATDSVDGQRSRPSGVTRFDLLNVVGSSPARLASPEADNPARSARASIAAQIWACVSIAACGGIAIEGKPGAGTIIRSLGIITSTIWQSHCEATGAAVVLEQGGGGH